MSPKFKAVFNCIDYYFYQQNANKLKCHAVTLGKI